jgi:diguanylate cyclase (GGDEF)-like protein
MVTGVETRGLKGLDLAAMLRAQAFYRALPIVVISSDENAEHRRRAAEIGVQAYIRKGEFGDRRLVQTARELLNGVPDTGSPAPAGMRVLIADDDAISRRMLEEAVRSLGHHVTLAHDGVQAWALAGHEEFDVIISDWVMPGIDGTELCRRIRERNSTPDTYTYFIVATSLNEKEHFISAMGAGADDYLTKPFDLVDVEVRLSAAQRVTSLYRQKAQDSAELSRLNRELFEQSRVDPLTQVGNRLRLTEDLEVLDARVQRYGQAYALAMFDVDHFKKYNDRYGHPAGDQVLRSVAAVIGGRSRQGDTVYRYGGEEFLVVLPEQSLDSARIAMEDVRRQIEELALPHEAKGPGGVVTVSIGVAATAPDTGETAPTALKRADSALYRAKESGRNRVVVDSPARG